MKNIHREIMSAMDERLEEIEPFVLNNTDADSWHCVDEGLDDPLRDGISFAMAYREFIQDNFHRHLVRKLQDEIEVLRKDRKDYL